MLPSFSQAADLMDKEALEERDRLSESLMRVRFAAFEKRRMELIHMVVKQRVCASLPSVICTPHTRAKKSRARAHRQLKRASRQTVDRSFALCRAEQGADIGRAVAGAARGRG